MACRRGQCAGIPLCNANVACVGFEAGVGEGCTGLAIGQSRLQINAIGELEICSNVGGICTCNAVDTCAGNTPVQNRSPTGDDDPCNTSGEGIFCSGDAWKYDPTLPGADTVIDGDCERFWIRAGGTCATDEWVEVTIPQIRVEVVAPVDGTDCCPVGTIWCVPVGTAGSTVDQIWISTSCTGGACVSWSKLCGYTNVDATLLTNVGPLAGFAFTVFPYDNEIADTLNEYDPVAGTFTAATAKTVTIVAGGQITDLIGEVQLVAGAAPWGVWDMVISVYVNAVQVENLCVWSVTTEATQVTEGVPNCSGSTILNLAAGDIVTFAVYVENTLTPAFLTAGDTFWNYMKITEIPIC